MANIRKEYVDLDIEDTNLDLSRIDGDENEDLREVREELKGRREMKDWAVIETFIV